MSGDHDPYSVLGVERSCDQETLKKRYQALAKEVQGCDICIVNKNNYV